MNCPSRVDPDALPRGHNQSPDAFVLNGNDGSKITANLRHLRDHRAQSDEALTQRKAEADCSDPYNAGDSKTAVEPSDVENEAAGRQRDDQTSLPRRLWKMLPVRRSPAFNGKHPLHGTWRILKKFAGFIGPGMMVAVAYIDPGNYATDVAAGADHKFKLLFMVLLSNIIAIFLQSLCIKLGSVTGMSLSENCRAHFPRWLNFVLYLFGEAAIIATDIAEVIGTAIALNLLLHIPIVAGCAISIFDVLLILIFYRPQGSMRGLRFFEYFVMALVLGVIVCFCIELSLVDIPGAGEVFFGYVPSSTLVESTGLYQACGILGATVMPHSLYLGSGLVQPRLKEYDGVISNSTHAEPALQDNEDQRNLSNTSTSVKSKVVEKVDRESVYKPSMAAIRSCMKYSIVELAISLGIFALFVNSAILIVAGASLSDSPNADNADLFAIHDLLSQTLAPAAGTIFALALLLSGTSAGIVCTIAGQIVSEGAFNWTVKPWVRRLMTRSIAITPSIIIAGAVGKKGLSAALEASQVALSVILPFVSAPVIYFTCRNRFMKVEDASAEGGSVNMRNHWLVTAISALLWLLIVIMNCAALVFVGLGKS